MGFFEVLDLKYEKFFFRNLGGCFYFVYIFLGLGRCGF